MRKSLIITEKPSVAQEFAKALHVSGRKDGYIENNEYVITWCVGHLVGLVYPEDYDEKYKKWKLEDLPFLPETYKYNVIENVKKQYDIVHKMLMREDIERVYWAGDAGKEGQTIEENIRNFGGVREGMEELRVWIDSQTEEEILRGIREAKPMSDYANLGNSGIMRTIEDYAMGINFSRVMSVKYGNLLNRVAGTKSYTAIAVGRVMTCVLGMVVNREREIRNFKETSFYRVVGKFISINLKELKNEKSEELQQGKLDTNEFVISEVEGRTNNSTLQISEALNSNCSLYSIGQDILSSSVLEIGESECGKIELATIQNSNNNLLESYIYAEWKAVEGSKYFNSPLLYKENGFKKQEDAQALIDFCNGKEAYVKSLEKFITKKKPPLLFNLAELQSECARRFKISPDETLQIAQELYEKKLTTYPRTDARVLSTAVAKEIYKTISGLKNYDTICSYVEHILEKKSYASITKTQYVNDSKVTDHYAIIPTGYISELKKLNALQKKVFELICRRFLSIFYPPAEYENVKLTIAVENENFFASAKALKKLGYLEVAGVPQKNEKSTSEQNNRNGNGDTEVNNIKTNSNGDIKVNNIKTNNNEDIEVNNINIENEGNTKENEMQDPQILLKLADKLCIGDKMSAEGYEIRQGKTSPPKRYTSGSMVLAMENAGQLIEDEELREQIKGSGIGTSATRAEIIKKLIRIGYLNLNKKTQVLTPENLGEMIFEVVNLTVPTLLNPKMTASWEKGLDGITKGTVDFNEYRQKLEDYIRKETLKMAEQDIHIVLAERIGEFAGKNVKGVKRKIGIKCPLCEGEIVTTPFGFGCSNYEKDNPNSCNFTIGEIAGVTLKEEQVKDLFEQGHTKTIRGFKSKSGKKFDAVLKWNKNEEGKVIGLKFDFEDVERIKVKGVCCPLCKGDIIVTPFGYGCSNYEKDNPNSCNFMIGKIAGVKLKQAQVKELLKNGKTGVIEGFVAKTGMKFHAPLKLTEEGKIVFDFQEKPAPQQSMVECPKCHKKMLKGEWQYTCECGFKIWHTVAKVPLSEEIMTELFTLGRTKEKVTGFTSKAGKVFDAYLKYEEDMIKFDF